MRHSFATAILIGSVWSISAAAQEPTLRPDYSANAYVVEELRTSWRFENDGTGRKDTYVRVKVVSDAGIQRWGQIVLGYNAATERMAVGPVRVRKTDGTVVTAATDAVQDLSSPVERVAPVYTDLREKHVTVPGLRPGDSLEFASQTTVHTAVAPHEFWAEYDFSQTGVVLDEQLQIDVPADRAVTLKTRPGLDAAIAEHDGRRIYTWHAARLEDTRVDDRVRAQRVAKKPEPAAVRLTTFRNWETVGRWYAELERAPRTPTADISRKAAELTAGLTSDRERFEALYQFVSENFRYVSLSFGTGRYQPHTAADVLQHQYGDCKDKHTLLASLAAAAHIRVSAALINSRLDIDPDFPSPSQFDHVITRGAIGADALWVDTTPEVAPFGLLSPTLRKKRALVVDDEGGRLVETPDDSPVPHSAAVRVDGSIDDAGALSADVHLAFTGDFELVMRSIFRRTPKAEWKTILDALMARERLDGEITRWNVSDPAALKTPFTIDCQTKKANFVTGAKKHVDLSLPLVDVVEILHDSGDDEDAVALGSGRQATYVLHLKLPAGYSAHAPLSVSVVRDYGEYHGNYSLDDRTFTAQRSLTLSRSELAGDRRDDYRAFYSVVSRDLRQTLALDRGSAVATETTAGLKADDLYASGVDAFDSGSYAQAASLLKRVTEIEPLHKRAWNQLGRAYLELNQPDQAVVVLLKQIAINPYDLSSYNNLGRAYRAQRKFAEAEAAFQKQIEINPLDRFAHANVGELYLDFEKYQLAAAELEKATTITPKDATLYIRLGQAYLGLGQHERATAAFDRAVDISPEPQSWNQIAYQLALHGTDLELAQRYAESAVSTMALKSRNVSLNRVSAWDLYYLAEMASDWDTLGWVRFAMGDFATAERFVAASWALLQNSEVGDHLAQIYEKRGRRKDAIRMYALALNAERPSAKTRARLAALVHDERQVDDVIRERRGDLMRDRTFAVAGRGVAAAAADVLILFGRHGVEAVQFVGDDGRLQPLVDAVRAIKYEPIFPDETPAKIVRRGTLSCSAQPGASACQLVLLLPRDAQLAAQR